MKLLDIAHARSGDKGNVCNIAIIAYDISRYPEMVRLLTVERVKAFFGSIILGDVERHELPQLGALNFVLRDALGGGVNRSLALDSHGKCLALLLLELELPDGA
jgi:hypothetical protein